MVSKKLKIFYDGYLPWEETMQDPELHFYLNTFYNKIVDSLINILCPLFSEVYHSEIFVKVQRLVLQSSLFLINCPQLSKYTLHVHG